MGKIKLTINGQKIETSTGTTILEAARSADIYIPTLCFHPDLAPAKGIKSSDALYLRGKKLDNAMPEQEAKGCGLCVVEVQGESELIGSCVTKVRENMVVTTDNERIRVRRQENLMPILSQHPHACLTCAQQEGCSRTQCSSNVPENERCCPEFGHCELQDVANYIGISDSTPKWIPYDVTQPKDHPLFKIDPSLCIGCIRCVRACTELKGVGAIGFVYAKNGRVIIGGTRGPSLEKSGCKFCTTCVEVCPTGALTDKDVKPGTKEQDIVPCKNACPANIDIPGYLRLIAKGKTDQANAVIREKVPFPRVLGRVCFHPCEDVCRRGEVNEPIAICALKRYAADQKQELNQNLAVKKQTGKKVAIIGAGPAGLTAGFYLRKQGHTVSVFEQKNHPGGMLYYGIPDYRVPKSILDQEVADIFKTGIEFKPNQTLGKDFSLNSLRDSGYDAVFLSVGAGLSRKIELQGYDLPDVIWGVDFLTQVSEGKDVCLKEKVVVIGGGNVAIDVAMTALRCGAKQVSMVSLETSDEMPASSWEIDQAVAEGIKMLAGWGPDKILSENGKVTGIELVECTCVFDDNKIFCPVFSNTKKQIPADQIILSIGQTSDLSFLENTKISTNKGLIIVHEQTLETAGQKGIYAGGDVVKAPGSVIQAISDGRKAAVAIDKALGQTGEIDEVLFERCTIDQYIGYDPDFANWQRVKIPELEPEIRKQNFDEISMGYDDEQAIREAKRCLQCDLRLCIGSNPCPPVNRLPFNIDAINQVPDTEGVYQLLDEDDNVLVIKGTQFLRKSLLQELEENQKPVCFEFEEDKMYSKRESELIQRYLQEHGEMPGADGEDLF